MTRDLHRLFVTLWLVALASVPLSLRWTILSEGAVVAVPLEILVATCAGMLAVMWAFGQDLDRRLLLHPVSQVVAIGLAWTLLTSITSVEPMVSLKFAVARAAYIGTFFVGGLWVFSRGAVKPGRVAAVGMIGFLPVVGWTLWHHATSGFAYKESIEIGAPFFSNHLEYGATLAFWMLLLFGLAMAFKFRSGRLGFMVSALVLGFLPVVWAAHSRSAWLAVFGGFGVMALHRLGITTRGILTLGALVLSLFFGVFSVYFAGGWSDVVAVGVGESREGGLLTEPSVQERLNRWSCSVRMAEERPWVGFGPGTFEGAYGYFQHHQEMTSHSSLTGGRGDAHSEFFSALAEQGFVGFLTVVVLFWLAIGAGLRAAEGGRDGNQGWVALGWTAALISLAVGCLFNSFFEVDRVAPLLWLACAAVVVMDRDREATNPESR